MKVKVEEPKKTKRKTNGENRKKKGTDN